MSTEAAKSVENPVWVIIKLVASIAFLAIVAKGLFVGSSDAEQYPQAAQGQWPMTQAVDTCKDMIMAAEPSANRNYMTVPTKHVDPQGMVLVRIDYDRGDASGWDKRAARCNAKAGGSMTLTTFARD